PNESFYWDGAQWQDMFYYEDPPWPAETANLCIKALTVDDDYVPVELTSFSAVPESGKIRLIWATAAETNNQQFEIQRRTINQEKIGEWLLVGYREGKGTTTEPQHYNYLDDISNINANAFEYRLKQVDFNGSYSFSEVIRVSNLVPAEYNLEQNYPNPFNPSTEIKFSIPQTTKVSLKVFDVMGREVTALIDEQLEAGKHSLVFNAANLSSGVYYYTIITENFIQTKKMILLK
ncbi:MAG: T9SS type A sorting domain-containing protein, partial [Ignavibacteria bacterium]|nr:T9SS type A sorting domain-containing protein [Ignavibacteria bacterium]